jgi:hypothetical protein
VLNGGATECQEASALQPGVQAQGGEAVAGAGDGGAGGREGSRPAGFFKALEIVRGEPRQSVQFNEAKEWIVLPAGDDVGVD